MNKPGSYALSSDSSERDEPNVSALAYDIVACPNCGNEDQEIFAVGTELASYRLYEQFNDFNKLNYVICPDCRLIFANPRLRYTDNTLDDLFPTHVQEQAEQNRPKRTVRLQSVCNKVADIADLLGARSGCFLEIGCGFGYAQTAATALGFEAIGTELYSDYIKRGLSEGLDIRQGSVDRIMFDDDTDDVLYMEDVLEHLKDPFTYLDEAARVVKNGGILFVHTWAIGEPGNVFDAFGADWREDYNLDLTAHTTIFPRQLLKDALTDRGFEIKKADLLGELEQPPASPGADRHIQFWDYYCRKS